MVTWFAAGGVSAFNPVTGTPTPEGILLNQAGSVDTANGGGVTRLQYNLDSGLSDYITAVARLNVTNTDLANNGIGTGGEARRLGAVMVVVDAVHFPAGKVPTPAEIRDKGPLTLQWRSTEYRSGTGAGNYTFNMRGPRASQLSPNAKYWVMVVPSTWLPNSASNYLNNRAIALGTENSTARAVSVWANRTPLAPVITSPVTGQVIPGGNTVNFSFDSNDPDRIVGNLNQSYTDLAGIQVQYSPRPNALNPNPTWIDLPWASQYGPLVLGSGWWIDGAASQEGANFDKNSGMQNLWSNRTAPLKCGSNTLSQGAGSLPAGDWRIRMRTFDYGHPYPGVRKAFARADGNITPANAPITNTSPWAEPINISVSAQVPPPLLVSPINSTAISDGVPVSLVWLYRNTASASYPQAQRTVQIRRIGVANWTTLVSGNSANTFFVVDEVVYPLDLGEYEWRVQVTDSTGFVSNYSEIGRFWIVPAPASGIDRPVPSSTIEGATLGCGKHTVEVFRRGGKRRVGLLTGVEYLDWSRVRDDISNSTVKVNLAAQTFDCGKLLAQLKCWAYELRITRNNGFSKDRVWEGPITLLSFDEEGGMVEIGARDIMVYVYRRNIRAIMRSFTGETVVSRAVQCMQNAMAPDDPNILGYVTSFSREDDARTGNRIAPAYSRTAFEEIDDMAANAGLDYTVAGRTTIFWDTHNKIGQLPEFKNENFGSSPIVSEYGMQMANVYAVSDGNGIYGAAAHKDSGITVSGNGSINGEDVDYGLVEMLSSTWAQDEEDEKGTYTEAQQGATAATFASYAARSVEDRYSPGAPVVVRVPDNTTLNPNTVVNINQLVPGVMIPLRSIGKMRTVVANQKLDSIKVVEESNKETISITMSPFNGDDGALAVNE